MNQNVLGKIIAIRGFELKKDLTNLNYNEVIAYLATCELVKDIENSNLSQDYYRKEGVDYSDFLTIRSYVYFGSDLIAFGQRVEKVPSEE
jgi:hypothetical protein